MDIKRRQYASEIHAHILRTEKAQEREEETLEKLVYLNLGKEVHIQKKAELTESINNRNNFISELQEKEKNIMSGKYDQELSDQYNKEKDKQKIILDAKKKHKKDIVKEIEVKKEQLTIHERARNPDIRRIKKDYDYFYRLYCKAEETLPDYIRKNLSEMPGNKGYIWRGCWYFGKNPPESHQVIMFEKMRGGIMRIHEVEPTVVKIYEKMGKEKKQLVSTQRRMVRKIRL